jgi:PIN domain nuclease of toxin-antitoxin system
MIVLDTHIWFWWINKDYQNLSDIRREKIENAERVAVSAISCFEMAWLERHRRVSLSCPLSGWFEKALTESGVELLSITPNIAMRAVNLYEHHSDPQDRIIIASAIEHNASLMSDDGKFPLYSELTGKLL